MLNYQLVFIMDVINILKKHENEIKEKFYVKRIGLFGSYV
jgi:predicted nucleotidyltransferase